MKGNSQLLTKLNDLLSDELTAISQYMVHSEMCNGWGYTKLHTAIEKQAIEEMHHAEWLIERILFLEGLPIVTKLKEIKIGKTVEEIIANDEAAEMDAIRAYNEAITLAHDVSDQATVDLLIKILKMEENHLDWADIQRTQSGQMGLPTYLGNQISGTA